MTEEADFWAGSFGQEYIGRNESEELLASNLAFFSAVFQAMSFKPSSIFEIGTNIGLNLDAIRLLAPNSETVGVEVNELAAQIANQKGHIVETSSIEDFVPSGKFDLVVSKGVLIHLNPLSLTAAYEKLERLSGRCVLIAEYFSPGPTMISYRGHLNRLYKRDFAGEFLSMHEAFTLRSSGFLSSRGVFPQDDINWYLLERR
jgi:pseudaminic acid biosynthesis-associated methylase